MSLHLAQPYALLLLLVLIFLLLWRVRTRERGQASLRFSSLAVARRLPVSRRQRFWYVLDVLRAATLILLVVALARPSISRAAEDSPSQGIDIVLAMDVSYSMAARDMGPSTRLETTKAVIQEFVAGRRGDRLGLVAFASEGVSVSPLTMDYPLLLQLLAETGHGRLPEGTAIGHGLATAVNLIREGHGKNRVIVLLTDGENNAGDITPVAAAEMARLLNIRVYAVGAGGDIGSGSGGGSRRGITTAGTGPAEEALRHISETTGGSYFRAVDQNALQEIYRLISQLEKTETGEQKFVELFDLRGPFLLVSSLLLLLEIGARTLGFRRIP